MSPEDLAFYRDINVQDLRALLKENGYKDVAHALRELATLAETSQQQRLEEDPQARRV